MSFVSCHQVNSRQFTSSTVVLRAKTFAFGPYRVDTARRTLLNGHVEVPLGSRALDILIALLEHAGQVVPKSQLISTAWPTTVVDDGNLRIQVAALRRTLAEGIVNKEFLLNVPGRGYCFVEPVISSSQFESDFLAPSQKVIAAKPPAVRNRLIGREEIVHRIAENLANNRVTTIVGPGGIGKTQVALEITARLGEQSDLEVAFADLGPIQNPELVAGRIASILGLPTPQENPLPSVLSFLRDRHVFLLLDSCEHVISAIALVVNELVEGCPNLIVLATSREALGTVRESLVRLPPLAVPSPRESASAAGALAAAAVQLFVQRANHGGTEFVVSDTNAALVSDICCRLDGIPLAIELAASHVATVGLSQLAANLDGRFWLQMRGYRTSIQRHQTLNATIGWSYDLLTDDQRQLARRLGVFAGNFSLASAAAIANTEAQADLLETLEALTGLVSKSLVSINVDAVDAPYRLLDTTRNYLHTKLLESGELELLSRRHAEHFRDLLVAAQPFSSESGWIEKYSSQLDNVRVALQWAFSNPGGTRIGVELTAAAVPLWTQLGLTLECCRNVERVLFEHPVEAQADSRTTCRLRVAHALMLLLIAPDLSQSELKTAIDDAIASANLIGDVDLLLRSIWAQWPARMVAREGFMATAGQFRQVASHSSEKMDVLVGDRLMAASSHIEGNQPRARAGLESFLEAYVWDSKHTARFQFDQRTTAQTCLARVLWVQGAHGLAMTTIQSAVEDARKLAHVPTLCSVLAQGGVPIAIWAGDGDRAEHYIRLLLESSVANLFDWRMRGQVLSGLVLIAKGSAPEGVRIIQKCLDERQARAFFSLYDSAGLSMYADALFACGHHDAAMQIIDTELERSHRIAPDWCTAEVMRAKGRLLLLQSPASAELQARQCFESAISLAREQGATTWELRAVIELAELERSLGNTQSARFLLEPVLSKFPKDYCTPDLTKAAALLKKF